ncbi:amino acid adenylation domain-containing protein [Pseudomonas sp. CAU 1711]|uniref:non-ribosomal peptide synthetase n=1 Tax=Pseudomonas sp. CAU 1711 TaxID=3140356 RepID=UPI00326005EC
MIDEGLPLSPEQQAALNAGLAAPQMRLGLSGALEETRLRMALEQVLARHDGLRMALRPSTLYRGLRQLPSAAAADWHDLDLRGAVDADARLRERHEALRGQPFDLENGQLVRVLLARLDEQAWRLALYVAPCAGDRETLIALLLEWQSAYADPAQLADEVFQYSQFIDWRSELDADDSAAAGRAYWAGLDQPAALRLPYRMAADTADAVPAGIQRAELPAELSSRLGALAEARQTSIATLLQAAWWALLARIAGQTHYLGGWQHDCRQDYEALAGSLGRYEKCLPLPLRLELAQPFAHWLDTLGELLASHVGWQEYAPLDEAGDAPGIGYAFARQPADRQVAGVDWHLEALPGPDSRFELALQVLEDDAGTLTLHLHHDSACYDALAARVLLGQYARLLERLATGLDQPILALDLCGAEDHRVQQGLIGPRRDFGDTLLPARLAQWAARQPQADALQAADLSLSYGQLHAHVERLAAALQRRGIGAEGRVALLMPRCGRLVLALLAVLRAGGAYLPLDPAWPAARLRKVLADAQPDLLLSLEPQALEGQPSLTLAELEADSGALTAPEQIRPEQAAYLLYTSGSTGEPKGVVIEHRQLLNYSAAVSEALGLDACRRFALTSSVAADLGNTTLFGALWNGGCLVVASDGDSKDAAAFSRFIREQRIDCLKMVPSHLAALLEDDHASLPATLVLGGEATPTRLVQRIRRLAPGCRLHNHYGPTETCVGVLVHSLPADDCSAGERLPLQRALANTYAYVLDEALRPVPLGAEGELYLGGAQVGRGYLNRDSDAFLDDPLRPGQRLYRSGDRARLLPDGRLLLLGRRDEQLKIRGFRVEPGELESALLARPGVRQAAVKVLDGQLLAYWVGESQTDELLAALRHELPDYLQPARLIQLGSLPRLANGKIDRQALPAPQALASQALQPPRDALEALLAELFAELLERGPVSIADSLFDLGGHSLLVIKLCARLRKLLQADVAPGLVFDHPSVAALAAALREQESTPGRLLKIAELRRQLAAMSPEQRAALEAKARAAQGVTG